MPTAVSHFPPEIPNLAKVFIPPPGTLGTSIIRPNPATPPKCAVSPQPHLTCLTMAFEHDLKHSAK